MNEKIKNILVVFFSRIFLLLLSVFTSFMIPMVLAKENFANYQMLLIMLGYASLLHFGYIDGINIKYAKLDYDELCESDFPGTFRMFLLSQFLVCLLLVLVAELTNFSTNIIALVAIAFLSNIDGVFTKLFFTTKRFVMNSVITVILRLIDAGIIFYVYFNKVDSVEFLIYTMLGIKVLTAVISIFAFRKAVFVRKNLKIKKYFKEYISLCFRGAPLVIAYLVSITLLKLDQLFVGKYSSSDIFADYSFAYKLINYYITILFTVKTVFYPYLARADRSKLGTLYVRLTQYMNLLFSATIMAIWIIPVVISFIPSLVDKGYMDSVRFYFLLFPVVLIMLQQDFKIWNYVNILEKQNIYLLFNVGVLAFSFVLNLIVLLLKLDEIYYCIMTIISLFLWNFVMDVIFSKVLAIKIKKDIIFQILILGIFPVALFIESNIVYSITLIVYSIVITCAIYYERILLIIRSVFKLNFDKLFE